MDKTRITNANKKQLHARRSAGAGESKEINMDKDNSIDGLRMTMKLIVFDPSTGKEYSTDILNDLDRKIYDACKGALEILERLDTDSDTISRQAALVAVKDALMAWSYMPEWRDEKILEAIAELPPAQPEQLEQCPIYGGMCAYPSNQCYDCPRHAGAKMEVIT